MSVPVAIVHGFGVMTFDGSAPVLSNGIHDLETVPLFEEKLFRALQGHFSDLVDPAKMLQKRGSLLTFAHLHAYESEA